MRTQSDKYISAEKENYLTADASADTSANSGTERFCALDFSNWFEAWNGSRKREIVR